MSKRPHKYGAKPTVVDGIRFASMKEAKRYQELKLLQKAGRAHAIILQPKFVLAVPRPAFDIEMIGHYVADFQYCECDHADGLCYSDAIVIEDVKGFKTPLYCWKKKHVEAQYGIQIREV
jgi:hypothetical protein